MFSNNITLTKTRLPYLALYLIIVYFSSVISAFGSLPPSMDNGFHLCGYGQQQAKNRRYARALANHAVGAPRTVRLVYFLPADRQPRQGIEEKIDALIKDVRRFFADQMEIHGFGRRTFNIETGHDGRARVHRVNGQFADTDYHGNYQEALEKIWREIHSQFDTSQNIYLALVDVGNEQIGDVAGVGLPIQDWGGLAAIPASGDFFNAPLAAHELGHAFGLEHDFRSTDHIMSYGPWNWGRTTKLSECTAKWLGIHRYFNPDIQLRPWNFPTIERISPRTYMPGSASVPIQLRVYDHEGLHQVLLLGSDDNVSECREFADEHSSLVEFDYNGTFSIRSFSSLTNHAVHPISARVVDTDGNVSEISFNLFPETLQSLTKISGDNQPPGLPNAPLPVPLAVELRNLNNGSPYEGIWVSFTVTAGGGRLSETSALTNANGRARTVFTLGPYRGTNTVEVSALGYTATFNAVAGSPVNLPDPLLLAAVAKTLNKVSGEPISQAEMATLTFTEPGSWSVGISHLTGLEFAINFTRLDLDSNALIDISPLARLTKLMHLALGNNSIANITPLAGLTNLKWLVLNENSVSDISPLAGLTGLALLHLQSNTITDISDIEGLTSLQWLGLGVNAISDISPLAQLTNLEWVYLEDNNIKDISPLTGLPHLKEVGLANNSISDLSPLAENLGVGDGTEIDVRKNPLSYPSIQVYIPALQERGVEIDFDNRTPATLEPISGDSQEGLPGKVLTKPFIVEVKDENGLNFEGVPVTFAVTAGDGTLDPQSTITDAGGRAMSRLTLGSNPGTNTVRVTAEAVPQPEIFTAEGIRVARKLSKITGDDQIGFPGETLADPFVIEVRDQFDKPLRNVQVTFAVTAGGGALIATTAKTDRRGRAQSKLTLGPDAGTNAVSVAASGIEQKEFFSAESIRTPQSIAKIAGDDQEALPGESLANPFVIEARDRHGSPLGGVQITFTVSAGGGLLTVTTTETDKVGRAATKLTLGPNAGTNAVSVTASGTDESEIFNAEGVRTPHAILKISGDNQQGLPGATLTDPFVVEVQDEDEVSLEGVPVTFAVTAGDGTLDTLSITTDAHGRAESRLTLGDNPGRNTVRVIVEGVAQPEIFTAEGIRAPRQLSIISGDDQKGYPGETLPYPLVVEVKDQFDEPLADVEVTFAVTVGAGTLTATTTKTDRNGRAQSELTLDPNAGIILVSVSVSGIEKAELFTAEGVRTPQTISGISGDDQEGLPNTPLANPLVVEVQDKNGVALEGVPVTFVVTEGDGTLGVTSIVTDSNGRAESTLTLGLRPGTHTVEASAEGVDESVVFRAEVKRREFVLSLPSGSSYVHIPLRVTEVDGEARTIESVGDLYDALGGAETVNLLTTRNLRTRQWHSYLGDTSRGTTADSLLADDKGIIASMRMPVNLYLVGDALGEDGTSTISLQTGMNLVGVPLKDARITRVSDLLSLEGIRDNVPEISVSVNGNFKVVSRAGDYGDVPIVGGQSFIMTAQHEAVVAISGDGWGSYSGTQAAPSPLLTGPSAQKAAPVLCLTGSIAIEAGSQERGLPFTGFGLSVIVKNLITGATVTTVATTRNAPLSKKVGYQLTLVESTSGSAARTGDTLEISAQSPNPLTRVKPLLHTVTPTDVKNNRIELSELIVYEIPAETILLMNYPNPFNPETWIPYQLAEDATVTLTIYDASGVSVRRLEMGHQPVGFYIERGKAAYWDGRNESGEAVASGLYFYQLATPSYQHLRRMVILK